MPDLSHFTARQRKAFSLWSIIQELLKDANDSFDMQNIYYFYKEPDEAVQLGLPSSKPSQHNLLIELFLSRDGTIEKIYTKDYRKTPYGKTASNVIVQASYLKLEAKAAELERIYQSSKEETKQGTQVVVVKRGSSLFLKTATDETLFAKFQPESTPDKLFSFLARRPNERIDEMRIHTEAGIAQITNISETVRKAGFTKEMKDIFFAECGKKAVNFTPDQYLSDGQIASIVAHIKSSKNRHIPSNS